MKQQWIYFRIALGKHFQSADTLIVDSFEKLTNDERVHQWFYLRYYEVDVGFHLRLRVKVNAQDVDAVQSDLSQKLNALMKEVPNLPKVEKHVLFNQGFDYRFDDKPIQVIASTYEPEFDKFGGEIGLVIAENWFMHSSQIALNILRHEVQQGVSRHIVVNHLTRVVCESFEVKPSIAKFLQMYASSWLPRNLVQSNSFRNKFFDSAIALIDSSQPLLTPLESLDDVQREQVQAWKAVAEKVANQLRSKGFFQGFLESQAWQLIHLMNNRLGFSPLDEAYLATMLEAWYREEARNAA